MAHYLVCYDISNPKRLGRVHRTITRYGTFVQFSVYYLEGTRDSLDTLLSELEKIIDVKNDDVRAYVVQPLTDALQIGKSWEIDGVRLYA